MFSENDIEVFRIRVDLPKREDKENLVEQLFTKYPLTTLKLSSMGDILVALREAVRSLPTMVLSGPGVSLNISNENLVIEIGKEREIKEPKQKEELTPFSEDNLRRISNDFNFLQASILGILKIESLDAKGYFRVSKKVDKDLRFDAFFSQNFWDSFKEFEGMYVNGISVEFSHPLTELKTTNRIRLSSEEKELTGIISCDLKIKGPIDIALMVKDRLEVINKFYKKAAGMT